MTETSADCPAKDHEKISARQLLPLLALELGYHMYVVDTTKSRESVIRRSSATSVAAMEKILASFGENNSSALYGLYFRAAATSLAKGIIRRKREQFKEEHDASKRLEDQLDQFALQERLSGLAKAAWQLLVLAGIVSFMFFAIKAVLTMPLIQVEVSNEHKLFTALAVALASGLIWPTIRAYFYRRAHRKVYDEYRKAMREVRDRYRQGMAREYKFAVHTVERAWEQLTGEQLPLSQGGAMQSLISVMGVNDGSDDMPSPEQLLLEDTALDLARQSS